MSPLCIYHGNCADGFGAAWVVNRFYDGEVEFYPGVYQRNPPEAEVRGRDVIFVDFCYKREVMNQLCASANTIIVLDHHKTAFEDMRDWGLVLPDAGQDYLDVMTRERFRTGSLFDMNRSGAGITWDFFFPDEKRPTLLNHIEDRDLWRFKLPHTREIQAALFSHPYEMDLWSSLINDVNMFGTEDMVIEGTALERKHHKDIAELCRVSARPMKFRRPGDPGLPWVVPAANLPYTLTSDGGHLLCGTMIKDGAVIFVENDDGKKSLMPFACCYMDKPEGRYFSLRSRDDGINVGEIAKQYGGGGHEHAAGFTVPYDTLAEFEL